MQLINELYLISNISDKVVERHKLKYLCKPHACAHVAAVLLPQDCLLLTLHSGRVSRYV